MTTDGARNVTTCAWWIREAGNMGRDVDVGVRPKNTLDPGPDGERASEHSAVSGTFTQAVRNGAGAGAALVAGSALWGGTALIGRSPR